MCNDFMIKGIAMMLIKSLFLLCLINYVFCKSHTRSLTESMGQEVIEIAAPIKELPQDLEEEPSGESEDAKVTSTIIPAATKKQFTKAVIDPGKKIKDIDIIDGRTQVDEEARIEKELADIYKDSLDYKADSAEVTKEVNVSTSSIISPAGTSSAASEPSNKPAVRARNEFKFQPDSTDPQEVARFRTSVDEISCDNYKLSATKQPEESNTSSSANKFLAQLLIWTPVFIEINL